MGRDCRGDALRRCMGLGDRAWTGLARGGSAARGGRAGGGPVRKPHEAVCRRQGFGRLAARPWRRARPPRRAGARGCADRRCPANRPDVRRKIAILGATGSIGKSTLDLVESSPERFEVVAVSAATNVQALADIARRTGAKLAVIADRKHLGSLENLLAGTNCRAEGGEDALEEIASGEADLVIAAIVGCAGLRPVMAAVQSGKTVALANKEALVTAGALMTDAADRHAATLLRVEDRKSTRLNSSHMSISYAV